MAEITKTIGGDRLGSGKKMQTSLHDYSRSTHNLSEDFKSSLAPGVLYPFYTNIGLKGDKFEIDLQAALRTLPTQGPLFGSYKLQLDMFLCPIRLYQGVLHNNPVNIGLKMNQVYLPKLVVQGRNNYTSLYDRSELYENISNSCLLKYLGLSGLPAVNGSWQEMTTTRKINAVPALAYFDIFKNYYANKQEENAYQIVPDISIEKYEGYDLYGVGIGLPATELQYGAEQDLVLATRIYDSFYIEGTVTGADAVDLSKIYVKIKGTANNVVIWYGSLKDAAELKILNVIGVSGESVLPKVTISRPQNFGAATKMTFYNFYAKDSTSINLARFPLDHIDNQRAFLLKNSEIGQQVEFDVGTDEIINMSHLIALIQGKIDQDSMDEMSVVPFNHYPLNGLVVKTYQSDIFNNWIQTDWIDGDDGITEITRIDVTEGLTMDELNLQQKIYNMLNRIAIAGGTYQDWQEAVYAEKANRLCETPVWVGGMSEEVVFDEIVQTSQTELSPLGSLGGRGRLLGNRHGGHIEFKCEEACVIMGIVSLTPRLSYSQGNAWYLTDLDSLDDLHKPALDGIGFQDLITEQMAWWDCNYAVGASTTLNRHSAGKVPAWIHYMTSFDKVYGDFAQGEGKSFMVLNRNYERESMRIKDLTTYIDPAKFNYAFAFAEREAQNFWVQIQSKIKARRKMSAKIIPNL